LLSGKKFNPPSQGGFLHLEPDMAGGRPTDYSTDLANEICARIAEGESLRSICRCDGMPNIRSVMRWLGIHSEFSQQYARAREAQAESMFEEMLEIADDGSNDWMERTGKDGETGDKVVDHEHVSRSKLRVDTRKWMLARMAPKKYGDATNIKLSGDAENPLSVLLTEISGNTLKPK
jgi:hypothetical protein